MKKKLNFKNKKENTAFNIGDICTIFAIDETNDPYLYGLRYKNRECLVLEQAFKLIKKKDQIYELW